MTEGWVALGRVRLCHLSKICIYLKYCSIPFNHYFTKCIFLIHCVSPYTHIPWQSGFLRAAPRSQPHDASPGSSSEGRGRCPVAVCSTASSWTQATSLDTWGIYGTAKREEVIYAYLSTYLPGSTFCLHLHHVNTSHFLHMRHEGYRYILGRIQYLSVYINDALSSHRSSFHGGAYGRNISSFP